MKISKFISFGSILTAFTLLFQAAPLYLPAIGMVLSPFSTLPIAIASVYNVSLGITVFISSVLLLLLFSIQEATILLFTTGLLGIVMGALVNRKGVFISTLTSSIALLIGILTLTYLVGISGFVEFSKPLPTLLMIIIFFSFSLVYSLIWNYVLRKFLTYLRKINLFKD